MGEDDGGGEDIPGFVGAGEVVPGEDAGEPEPHAASAMAMPVESMSDAIREIMKGPQSLLC